MAVLEYIATGDLTTYYVDKDTGAALAGGYIQFWVDSDRTTPKLVFEKQNIGADPVTGQPVYQYVELPNPVQLSSVGTPVDNNNNPIVIYYYPFDAEGNVELYFIQVCNYAGEIQETREGWPNSFATDEPGAGSNISENQISNPQFVYVNFDASLGLTINFSGTGTSSVEIAPDWFLNTTHTGTGSVTVTRTAIAGNALYPTNPPYTLSIAPGANISQLTLSQRLPYNPGIWSPQTSGVNGYVAANILLGPSTTGVTVSYTPSSGTATTLLTASNATSDYVEYSNTTQLPVSNNSNTADTGFVNIIINLSTSLTSTLSSIQIVGLGAEITGIEFEQEAANRQLDHLFNYYNSLLQAKPIPSYLVGWDFPKNPAQFLGTSISAQSVGANKSYYAWDQTIVFQSANSGLTISRDSTGALKILAAQIGQHALVQYLPAAIAIEMLSRRKCVMVCANGSVAKTATVSLWYTKTTLPSTIGSNNSIVATLDANGYPATLNGTWVQVPRSGLNNNTTTSGSTNAAQFTIPVAPSGAANFNQIPLSGWDMQGNTDINSATFFAIVIGTASMAMNDYMLYQDISCQDGDIPTVSAPKTVDQVLHECQYYYESSFPYGTPPQQALGGNTGEFLKQQVNTSAAIEYLGSILFNTVKYAIPHGATGTITTYSPTKNDAQVLDETTDTSCSSTTVGAYNYKTFMVSCTTVGSAADLLAIHWAADCRLGQ